jgi:hypothetical protein
LSADKDVSQNGRKPGPPEIRRGAVVAALFVLHTWAAGTRAQSAEPKAPALNLPSLVRAEVGQCLYFSRSGKRLATDRFRLTAGSDSLYLSYSNHPIPLLNRLQFQTLPFGYRLAGLSLKRSWGALTAFRSTGFGSGLLPAHFAQRVMGAVVEVPKGPFSTRVSGYFLRASGRMPDGRAALPHEYQDASQAGVEISRALKRGLKLQAEWTHSLGSAVSGLEPPARRGAFYLALTGEGRRVDSSLVFRDRGGGFSAAAVAGPGQAVRTTTMTLQRSLKQHLLSYSGQRDAVRSVSNSGWIADGRHQESLRWTFSPRLLPVISAGRTWLSHESPGRRETEESSSISISKTAGPLGVSLLHSRHAGASALPGGRAWVRESCGGDIAIVLIQKRKLELHFERGRWLPGSRDDILKTTSLRMNTTLSAWGDTIMLAPVVSYQSQNQGNNPATKSVLALAVNTQIKLPHRIPGTGLAVVFSAHRSEGLPGVPEHDATVAVRWSFKSF